MLKSSINIISYCNYIPQITIILVSKFDLTLINLVKKVQFINSVKVVLILLLQLCSSIQHLFDA